MENKTITIELKPWVAFALAQFCKRVSFSDLRAKAVDDEEADRMQDAIYNIQKSLAEVGVNPR